MGMGIGACSGAVCVTRKARIKKLSAAMHTDEEIKRPDTYQRCMKNRNLKNIRQA